MGIAGGSTQEVRARRMIVDHTRAALLAGLEGVKPGRDGRESVVRRLIRRAARQGRLLGIDTPFLSDASSILGMVIGGPGTRTVGCLGAAEVDRHGSLNSTELAGGRFLVGSGGANDVASRATACVSSEAISCGRRSIAARIEALASASISRTAPRSLSKMSSIRAGSNSDVVGRLLITRVFGKSAVTRLDRNGL